MTFDYLAAIARATSAAEAYYHGADAIMTDAEYDDLLDSIQAHETANPDEVIEHHLFDRVAAGTAGVARESGAQTVAHEAPMLSLDKVKTLDEVDAFEARVQALGGTVSLEPKLDGIAVNAKYVDGELTLVATRGNGTEGEDITIRALATDIAGLPRRTSLPGTVNVRGELLMTADDFAFSNRNRVAAGKTAFANPRNATAGTIRNADLSYDVRMTFVSYDAGSGVSADLLSTVGFITAASLWRGHAGTTLRWSIAEFGDHRSSGGFPYPTDGIVIKADQPDVRERMGATSRAPRWAMAYKYEAERGITTIRDIEVGVGRTGNISYTALFDPVLIDGSTVSRATLHNPKFIADNDIRIGSESEVFKANDIIPRIVKVLAQTEDSVPYEPSIYCPVSGAELDRSGEIWRSTDPSASLGALIAYVASRDVLDIDGLSTAIADALVNDVDAGALVNDLGDLFTLQAQQLATLKLGVTKAGTPRLLGTQNAEKVLANIGAAKSQPLNRVITALGIRKSGRTFGRRLASHFHTMDALLNASYDDFLNSGVEGVGPERARLFHEGFQRMRPVIEKMRLAGVNMGEEPSSAANSDGRDALPLAGMKVVVTGAMDGPLAGLSRNEVNELIEARGGKSSGSVSKTTSLLVCLEPGSTKFVKAAQLGVRIVTPTEFAEMIQS